MAAALIFDVAPHMEYVRENKTRLDAAKEIGQWLLAQLPPESQIAVFDSGLAPATSTPIAASASSGSTSWRSPPIRNR